MSSALTPPYMRRMLRFFNGYSALGVLKHAIAVAVADEPRKKFAIAQLVLHKSASANQCKPWIDAAMLTLMTNSGSTHLLSSRI
jgi:hypothetical protein